MSKEMLINVSQGQECRIAVVDSSSLEELYIERPSLVSHVGNMYKARVVNVEPAIQAAFVDFGTQRNGFLHISDLHPRYFQKERVSVEKIGRRKALSQRPHIQKSLKKGQEILVQVTKEGINTKGPTLTTYISLPGRYIVLMPWMDRVGVSQKIEEEAERKRLRETVEQMELPKDAGLIIRTAAQGATKRDLQNDLAYLSRLWSSIQKRIDNSTTPAEVYQESDLVIRTVRDIFSSDISKVTCDNESVTRQIRDFLGIVQPRLKGRVILYEGQMPLFHKFGIEKEINRIRSSRVDLKSGGSLVIEPTEAMVAIDVNSGKYRKPDNAEQTALKINLEAAQEIVRQLRLRDLGGLIVCDFIDMRDSKNRREVEKVFREALKKDRARSRALRMSQFGLIELTRQRMRPSLQSSTSQKCPHCGGTGSVKSAESQSIELVRLLESALAKKEIRRAELRAAPSVAEFLLNDRRGILSRMETEMDKTIVIRGDASQPLEGHDLICFDERGSEVRL
ncbi:MAG: Rne/Rng family ribonuclease [Phycisphaerae bacterium]|nr:Rne/Rng family ribonuclease [Phycisphaerae bacterium]